MQEHDERRTFRRRLRRAGRNDGQYLETERAVPACEVDERDRRHDATSRSRNLNRWILPVAVFGNSSMNSIVRGYLYGASLSLTKAFNCIAELRVAGVTALQHDIGLGLGQAVGVGLAHDGRFEHRRVLHQRGLDLERRYVDAAHLEHVVARPA